MLYRFLMNFSKNFLAFLLKKRGKISVFQPFFWIFSFFLYRRAEFTSRQGQNLSKDLEIIDHIDKQILNRGLYRPPIAGAAAAMITLLHRKHPLFAVEGTAFFFDEAPVDDVI